MDTDKIAKVVREILARELAPLNFSCAQMQARIDHIERTLPQISDRHERIAARVQLIVERARLNAAIAGMRSDCSVRSIVCRIKGRRL
jgi:hypothetical protein